MILYHPSQNWAWKPLQNKELKLLIVHTSALEIKHFEKKQFDPIPPPFPYPGKGGGSGGYIPRRALGGSTAGAACQGQSRRCAAVLRTLDRLSRLCYGWRGDGGYIQQSRRGQNGENGRGYFWSRCPEVIQKHRFDFYRKRCFA